jgi:hypothetical protein
MPTVVKQHIDAKPAAATTGANALGTIVLLLGIVAAAALLASMVPPFPSIDLGTDMFFAP